MIYSTPEFFALFAVTLFGMFVIRSYSWRFFLLLASSLFFYSWSGIVDSLIFLAVVFVSWLAVALAHRFPRQKNLYLVLGVTVMASHLFFWKYAPWGVSQIQILIPHFLGGKPLELPLPVGISFFTLQGIAYLIDFKSDKASFMNFREYALFKSFFPQLVAGPIVRASELLPQLRKLDRPTLDRAAKGLALFGIGFAKKMAIADRIAPYVEVVFHSPHNYGRLPLFLALAGYSVQIWADFSGYTDMGRGAANLLGIELPENFLAPYLSRSPSEFWKRWHITLSRWIKSYIYKPLVQSWGNRSSVGALGALLVTMLISGFWHGASWTFALWGLYHGLLLVGERLLEKSPLAKVFAKLPLTFQNTFATLLTFGCTLFGWLIFRADGLEGLMAYLNAFTRNQGTLVPMTRVLNLGLGFAACILLHALFYWDLEKQKWPVAEKLLSRLQSLAPLWQDRSLVFQEAIGFTVGILFALFFLGIILIRSEGTNAFIYFQF